MALSGCLNGVLFFSVTLVAVKVVVSRMQQLNVNKYAPFFA